MDTANEGGQRKQMAANDDDQQCERRNLTVTFGRKVNILVIPNISSYSKTQIKRMWYQRGDYLSMKCTRTMEIANLVKRRNSMLVKMNNRCSSGRNECRNLVAADETDNNLNFKFSSGDEYLGLVTPQQREEHLQRIYQSQRAVFEEQDLQRQENIIDVELLADVYFDMTIGSQHEAIERAKLLAMNQRKIRQQQQHHPHQQYQSQPLDIAEHITTSLKVQPPSATTIIPFRRLVVERRSLLLTSIMMKATKLQMTRCL